MRSNVKINDPLINLPLEIYILIALELDPISLIYLRVNKYFYSLISSKLNTVWQHHFSKQFTINKESLNKRKSSLSTLFVHTYVSTNLHLSKKEKECFYLICANDLYQIKKREIEFNFEILEKKDSYRRTLLSLIRMQNNHALNQYVFDSIQQNLSTDTKYILSIRLLETAIKLDLDNNFVKTYLENNSFAPVEIKNEYILSFAVSSNALRVVKLLLELNADPNYAKNGNCPPLHIAAKLGFLDILNELLAHKDIQIDQLYKGKYTPLYMAACEGHKSIVEVLLKKGADVNGKAEGYYPLFIAMQEGRTEIVNYLLEHHANVFIESDGFPLIYIAAANNQLEGLKILVTHCKQNRIELDFEAKAHDESTALYVASQNGFTSICHFLTDQGAKLDGRFHQYTPLFIASANGHFEIIKLLYQTQNPTEYLSPIDMCSIIINAYENERQSIARYLLHELHNDKNYLTQNNFIHRACLSKRLFLVKVLITLGIPVNSRNEEDETPLQIAATLGCTDIVDFLLEKGADPNVNFKNGDTIIKTVCNRVSGYHQCLSIVRSLIKAGAALSSLTTSMKIINHRVATILLPALELLESNLLTHLVNVRESYECDKDKLIGVLNVFIVDKETIYQSCKDAKLCLNFLKNVSTPFGCTVILYAVLAKRNNHSQRFLFNTNDESHFVRCVINTFHFQSYFTALQSLYVTINASLGFNKPLLNVLKELVIEPIASDAVTMSNDTFQTVLFALNLFEAKIKKAPILDPQVNNYIDSPLKAQR